MLRYGVPISKFKLSCLNLKTKTAHVLMKFKLKSWQFSNLHITSMKLDNALSPKNKLIDQELTRQTKQLPDSNFHSLPYFPDLPAIKQRV